MKKLVIIFLDKSRGRMYNGMNRSGVSIQGKTRFLKLNIKEMTK